MQTYILNKKHHVEKMIQKKNVYFIIFLALFLVMNSGCINKESSEVDQLIESAIEQHKYGRYDTALMYYDQALDLDPGNELAWIGKGSTYYNLDQKDNAVECFDVVLENSDDKWFLNTIATYYSLCEQHEKSIESYDRILDIDSNDYAAWSDKGNTYHLYFDDYDAAIACYEKSLDINPNDGFTWWSRGRAFESLGRNDVAIESYNNAIECYNKVPEDDFGYSFALSQIESTEKRIEELK